MRVSGEYTRVSRKSGPRVHEKCRDDYGGDVGRLVDFERGGAVFRDVTKAAAFVEQVRAKGIEGLTLRRWKDRLNNPLPSGYRDWCVSTRRRFNRRSAWLSLTATRLCMCAA